jgi:hypothetical protein
MTNCRTRQKIFLSLFAVAIAYNIDLFQISTEGRLSGVMKILQIDVFFIAVPDSHWNQSSQQP